jgi:hypothetical protein
MERTKEATLGKKALILSLLISCSTADIPPPVSTDNQTIRQKYYTYLDLAKKETDSYGATYTKYCDSLLWSSLYHVSGGAVEIDAFREGFKWYRRPSKDCWPRFSRSSISRDQLLGLLHYILTERRADLIEGTIQYAEDNGFVMGEGSLGATQLTVNFLALMGRVGGALGVETKYQFYPYYLPAGVKSYHAHLQLLGILLYYRTEGRILDNHKRRIVEHYNRNNDNALAAWMYSRFVDISAQSKVVEILLNERWFPSNRLPSPADRCSHYLWQRDKTEKAHTGRGTQWEPCPKSNDRFMGGDFLLVAALYLGIM